MSEKRLHKCKRCGNVIILEKDGGVIIAVHGGHQLRIARSTYRSSAIYLRPSKKTVVCDGTVTRTFRYGESVMGPCRTTIRVSTFKEVSCD